MKQSGQVVNNADRWIPAVPKLPLRRYNAESKRKGGQVAIDADGWTWWRESDGESWLRAAFHHVLRPALIKEAAIRVKYGKITMSRSRFRDYAACIAWAPRDGSDDLKAHLEAILPKECLQSNSTRTLTRDFTRAEVMEMKKPFRNKHPERAGKRAISDADRKKADDAYDKALENAKRKDEEQQLSPVKKLKMSPADREEPVTVPSTPAPTSNIPARTHSPRPHAESQLQVIDDGGVATPGRIVQDEVVDNVSQAIDGVPPPSHGMPLELLSLDNEQSTFSFEEFLSDDYLHDASVSSPQVEIGAPLLLSPWLLHHSPEEAAPFRGQNSNSPFPVMDYREVSPIDDTQLQNSRHSN
ncbi:MAG: hypothetical protein Q9208_002782 [Pyrenodesmia sp. 3 TL-2023]